MDGSEQWLIGERRGEVRGAQWLLPTRLGVEGSDPGLEHDDGMDSAREERLKIIAFLGKPQKNSAIKEGEVKSLKIALPLKKKYNCGFP